MTWADLGVGLAEHNDMPQAYSTIRNSLVNRFLCVDSCQLSLDVGGARGYWKINFGLFSLLELFLY